MAELGAIAAVVQLVDVTLRASGEVRGFLDAYKDTGRDVKALREALQDVEANVRNLMRYITEFKRSKNATEEFEVLSETITGCLKGFDDDILALKRLVPSKPAEKIKEKLGWVLNKRKAQDMITRLNERSTRLNTALEVTGRLHDLRIRQDMTKIIEQQAASSISVSKQMKVIDQNIHRHDQDHAKLLDYERQIITSIDVAHTASARDHRAIVTGISQQASLIKRRTKRLDDKASLLAQKVEKSHGTLNNLQSQAFHEMRQAQEALENLHADVKEIRTNITFKASNDTVTQIVREELRTNLKPILEQALNASDTRHESRMQRMEDMVQYIASDLGRNVHEQQSNIGNDTVSKPCGSLKESNIGRDQDYVPEFHGFTGASDSNFPDIKYFSGVRCSTSTYRRYWYHKWKVGSLQIDISHTCRRVNGSPKADSSVTIYIHFRPKHSFLSLPGVSFFYSTAPTQHGYYNLAPMIATFPIIPSEHPVIEVFRNGDLRDLQMMLASGDVHIRCQTIRGETLLHYAAECQRSDMCSFLALQGLSWYQSFSDVKFTPLHSALYYMFSGLGHNSLKILNLVKDIDCNLDQLWWESIILKPENVACKVIPLNQDRYVEVYRYMMQNLNDVWHHICASVVHKWSRPTWGGLKIIRTFLDDGFDPNLRLYRLNLWSGSGLHSPLLWALLGMKSEKEAREETGAVDSNDRIPTYWTYRNYPDPKLWCIVETLISAGADPFESDSYYFDTASTWHDLHTLCTRAYKYNVLKEWSIALAESGLDPDKVCWEDERRCKQAIRLRGASRSGFDEQVLELPSIAGLRCRACRRTYCETHKRDVFD